jgi:hypothetical protein
MKPKGCLALCCILLSVPYGTETGVVHFRFYPHGVPVGILRHNIHSILHKNNTARLCGAGGIVGETGNLTDF